jgi:hypothetical protein
MAIWQFNLTAIPRIGIIEKFGYIPERLHVDFEERKQFARAKKKGELDEEDFQLNDALIQNWWNSIELQPLEVIHQIDKLAKRADGYGTDLWVCWKTYFDTNDNPLDNDASLVINENTGMIEELNFRADLREKSLTFLIGMVNLAKLYDWLLMDIKGNLSEPEMKEVVKLIVDSDSFKFLQDPKKFLEDLVEKLPKTEL